MLEMKKATLEKVKYIWREWKACFGFGPRELRLSAQGGIFPSQTKTKKIQKRYGTPFAPKNPTFGLKKQARNRGLRPDKSHASKGKIG
jgi:hypothetical protein